MEKFAFAGMKNQKKLKRKARELEEVQAERDLGDRLVPPGSVFHFVRRDDGHVEMEQTSFKPFMEIIISQTMFTDHMPYVYEKVRDGSCDTEIHLTIV